MAAFLFITISIGKQSYSNAVALFVHLLVIPKYSKLQTESNFQVLRITSPAIVFIHFEDGAGLCPAGDSLWQRFFKLACRFTVSLCRLCFREFLFCNFVSTRTAVTN